MNKLIRLTVFLSAALFIPLGTLLAQSFLSIYTDQLHLAEKQAVILPLENVKHFHYPELGSAKLEFNEDNLGQITDKIEEKEFKQALGLLDQLDFNNIVEDDPDDLKDLLKTYQQQLILTKFKLGYYQDVIAHSRFYLSDFEKDSFSIKAFYYLSLSLLRNNSLPEFMELATDDNLGDLNENQEIRLRKALSNQAKSLGHYYQALSFLINDGELVAQFETNALDIISDIKDPVIIDQVIPRIKDEKIVSSLKLQKAEIYSEQDQNELAQNLLDEVFQTSYRDKNLQPRLQELNRKINIAKSVNPHRVGVILPFSHKRYSALSEQVLEGLELAAADLFSEKFPIEFVLRDSKLRPERTTQLVEELVEKENVIAIIGPLAKLSSLAAGKAAAKYKVPVISLSLTDQIGKELPYLFRNQASRRQEATVMADYAIDYLNANRFVIFYPAGTSASYKADLFKQQIQKRGGVVAGLIKMGKGQVDYQNSFLDITGGNRQITEEEQKEIRKKRDRFPSPIIDFDAVYIPTNVAGINMIDSFARMFDINKIWFMAGSKINTPESYILNNPRRTLFTDNYSFKKPSAEVRSIFSRHWKMYNFKENYQQPGTYTIYAYRTFEILSDLIKKQELRSRSRLTEGIRKLKGFPVSGGKISASDSGDLLQEISVFPAS